MKLMTFLRLMGKRRKVYLKRETLCINMFSPFATSNWIELGQVKTTEKSIEFAAVLKILDIHRYLVTIDEILEQCEITTKIVNKGGRYLSALKCNQKRLQKKSIK